MVESPLTQDSENVRPERHPIVIFLLANARWLWPALVIALVAAVSWSDLRSIDYHQVRRAMRAQDISWLVYGAFLTAANLVLMGLYDVITLRATRVGIRERWWTGVLAFAWSNFLTLGPLAGPAIRFWLYRPAGVSFSVLRQAIVSIALGFGTGLGVWLVASLVRLPATGAVEFLLRAAIALGLAQLLGKLARSILAWPRVPAWMRDMKVHWSWLFTLGAADWLLAFAVFGCMLRSGGIVLAPDDEARMFFIGQGVGLASLIPGGLGSADAFWLTWLAPFNGKGPAALVVYRLIYYLLPWAGATLLLIRRTVHGRVRWAGTSRLLVSSLVLAAGCIILASAATPGLAHRMRLLRETLPFAVLETSHVATATIGLFLLVLSRGLRKGYRTAYRTTLGLLLAGAVGSILKGLDYEEAILLLLTAALLWTHSSLFTSPSRPGGTAISILAPIALALFVYAAVGLTAFRGAGSLLDTLGHAGYAGRFLRTLSVLFLLALLVAIYLILRKPHRDTPPSDEDIGRALTLHDKFGKGTNPLMVLNRDKCIHFLGDTGFCLYRTTGKYLVVFSDPVLAPGTERQFLASLLDRAAAVDRSLVFYQVSANWIPILHDFGYSFFKLGEEAVVDLGRFNIQGNKGKAMRNVLNRFRNDGYEFQVVPAAEVAGQMQELRRVSDEWLSSKGSKEKQFSIGFFDERYLSSFPCALVSDRSRKLVAFANILTGPAREELSVDLMRYVPECPNGVMDFLFLNLFEWGKQQGFHTFNLGMAPLATVGEVRQARVQERLANIVFQHGEHWYNFRGLRQFKEKYGPAWVPRYLAYPSFWMWAQAIVSIAALIAGGWRSIAFPVVRPASSPRPDFSS